MIGERLSRIQTRWCCYQCALLTVATVGRECVKRILNRILKDSAFGVCECLFCDGKTPLEEGRAWRGRECQVLLGRIK